MRALRRGLELAGRRGGLRGDAESVATETAAQIAAGMILRGDGDQVLKLLALTEPKTDSAKGAGGKSPLLEALERRMMGTDGPQASQAQQDQGEMQVISATCQPCPSDCKSDGGELLPAFAPQGTLLPPLPMLPPDGSQEPAREPKAPRAHPPYPPSAPPTPGTNLRGENLEKNRSQEQPE